MDQTLYRLLAGVHRSVAAREACLTSIRAQVDVAGGLGPVILVPLANLFSPKDHIGRFDRNRDFFDLIRIMQDPVHRDTLDPVIVKVLAPQHAHLFTPISIVIVTLI